MANISKNFTGIQIDAWAVEERDPAELLDELLGCFPMNAALVLTHGHLRQTEHHRGGTYLSQPESHLDSQGRDYLDRLNKPAEERGVEIILGAGEQSWGYNDKYPGYTPIAMVDCYGRTNRQSCVNNPTWKAFQLATIEDNVREHPFLSGIMFMHERVGPMSAVFFAGAWQGGRNPWCFCDYCRAKGHERGIDIERAKTGYKKLLAMFDEGAEKPNDGCFISYMRLLGQYPEILAWNQLMWDSMQDFRAAIAGAVRVINPDLHVGFHFQNATLTGQIFWRAFEDPERVIEYADWVKPSVYPAVSGQRYRGALKNINKSLLGDMTLEEAHAFISRVFLRSPEVAAEQAQEGFDKQTAFPASWVESEVRRLKKSCAPKPL
ncbi:MAG: hypothetical protein ACOC29_03695, partial [Candidatus Sumerlaeota bacterium]